MRLLRLFPLLLAVACASAPPPSPTPAYAAPAPTASAVPAPSASAVPTEIPEPPPPPAPVFPHDAAARSRLTTELSAILDTPPARALTHGIEILDAETGTVLFARRENQLLTPASNTKLFTTLGALDQLGAQHRPEVTFALAGIHKNRAEVLLVDARLCPIEEPFPSLDKVIAPLIKALQERHTKSIDRVVIKSPALIAPDRFKELDLAQHRERTVVRLRKALAKVKIRLGKLSQEEASEATPVATHSGPSLAEWIAPINQLSHNGLADGLSQYLGLHKGKAVGYSEGTRLVLEAMNSRKIGGISLADGSGLSRQNKVSAHSIAMLLRDARDIAPFVASLSIAGELGTLAGRFKETPLQGHVRGKTGTLKEVVATSGYLDHPSDQRRYIFAMVTNDIQEGKGAEVRQIHDALLTALGGAWMKTVAPVRPGSAEKSAAR